MIVVVGCNALCARSCQIFEAKQGLDFVSASTVDMSLISGKANVLSPVKIILIILGWNLPVMVEKMLKKFELFYFNVGLDNQTKCNRNCTLY